MATQLKHTSSKRALSEFGPIILSPKYYAVLMENLNNPPGPNAALKRGMTRLIKANITRKGILCYFSGFNRI